MNQEASVVLSDANLLSSESAELATNVSASGERLAELEGVAVRDAEAISMTTRAAQTAISEADELQADIRQLLVRCGCRECHQYCACVIVFLLCLCECAG